MKILIISDIHLNDYPDRSYYDKQRLLDFRAYTDQIISIAKNNECNTLIMAGDIIDKATNRPYILHEIKDMLSKFGSNFNDIYYILGQHDRDARYGRVDYNDSVIHILATPNMHYMDHKIATIKSRSFAFMNFYKEQDLSWIADPVDVFIGHVTLNTNGWGQDIDQSKYTLGICGDIHYPCSVGNTHSVGVQVQRYLGDAVDGTCVVLDPENLSWTRVKIDPNRELFTRYVYTSNPDEEGFSDEKNLRDLPKWYKVYQAPVTEEAKSLINSDTKFTTITELISGMLEGTKYSEVHKEVLSRFSDTNSVDLDFELISIKIDNIRSIKQATYDFKNGTTVVVGPNGGGKSSFLWAVFYALYGGTAIRDEMTEGESYAKVELTLKYRNSEYIIWRDTTETAISRDGQWLSYPNKRATEDAIWELLPFIRYYDSYVFLDNSPWLLSGSGSDRRMQLLSTYFRLDLIQSYSTISDQMKSEANEEWTSYNSSINAIKDKIKIYEDSINDMKSKISIQTDDEILAEIVKLKEELRESTKAEEFLKSYDYNGLYSEISELKSKVSREQNRINELNSQLAGETDLFKSKLGDHASIDDLRSSIEIEDWDSLMIDISDLKSKIDNAYNATDAAAKEYNSMKATIDSLTLIKCPNCSTEFDPSKGLVDKTELESRALNKLDEFNVFRINYEKLKDQLSEVETANLLVETRRNTAKSKKARLDSALLIEQSIKLTKSKIEYSEGRISTYKDLLVNDEEKIKKFSEYTGVRSVDEVMADLTKLTEEQALRTSLRQLESEKKSYEESSHLTELESKLSYWNDRWYLLDEYSKLFSTSGEIYHKVLNSIVESFNSDKFRYSVYKGRYRGKDYLDISCEFKLFDSTVWRSYSRGSRGQKTLCELDFLRNLITGTGLIILDEFLNYLRTENQVEAMRIIKDMKSRVKLVTTQDDNCSYYDSRLMVDLINNESIFKEDAD